MALLPRSVLYNENNVPITKILYHPYTAEGPITIYKDGRPGKINMYELYMQFCVDDPTEMDFVEYVYGDLTYWFRLIESPWFIPHLEEWRMHAAEKRKQKAFKAIADEVSKRGKSAFTAAKYLIEEPWRTGSTVEEKKRLKQQISKTAEAAFQNKEFQSDIERLKEQGLLQ